MRCPSCEEYGYQMAKCHGCGRRLILSRLKRRRPNNYRMFDECLSPGRGKGDVARKGACLR